MPLDLGDGFVLRQATAADHAALSAICLQTGDAGRDATAREDAADLLGLVHAIPYQVLEPALAFLIEGPGGPAGYLLGAVDTAAFNRRLATEWYPHLRTCHADPGDDPARWRGSDWLRHRLHHPALTVPPRLAKAYPSHGHIDLLPHARGRGIGARAMAFLEDRLRASGSPGLHLEVACENIPAQRFYRAIGYARLQGAEPPRHCLHMVKSLAV